jgi:hypothetical protein
LKHILFLDPLGIRLLFKVVLQAHELLLQIASSVEALFGIFKDAVARRFQEIMCIHCFALLFVVAFYSTHILVSAITYQ